MQMAMEATPQAASRAQRWTSSLECRDARGDEVCRWAGGHCRVAVGPWRGDLASLPRLYHDPEMGLRLYHDPIIWGCPWPGIII